MNPKPIDLDMQQIIEFYKQDADRPYREAEEPMSLVRLHFLLFRSAKPSVQTF